MASWPASDSTSWACRTRWSGRCWLRCSDSSPTSGRCSAQARRSWSAWPEGRRARCWSSLRKPVDHRAGDPPRLSDAECHDDVSRSRPRERERRRVLEGRRPAPPRRRRNIVENELAGGHPYFCGVSRSAKRSVMKWPQLGDDAGGCGDVAGRLNGRAGSKPRGAVRSDAGAYCAGTTRPTFVTPDPTGLRPT